jgi:hypothetical protein
VIAEAAAAALLALALLSAVLAGHGIVKYRPVPVPGSQAEHEMNKERSGFFVFCMRRFNTDISALPSIPKPTSVLD